MKIFSLNNITSHQTFKGQTKPISEINEIQKQYPYAEFRQTNTRKIGLNTGNIYVTDPLEVVSDNIKKSHDIIVYDNEPVLPAIEDMGQNYFGRNRSDYSKLLQARGSYFQRLIDTDKSRMNMMRENFHEFEPEIYNTTMTVLNARVAEADAQRAYTKKISDFYRQGSNIRNEQQALKDVLDKKVITRESQEALRDTYDSMIQSNRRQSNEELKTASKLKQEISELQASMEDKKSKVNAAEVEAKIEKLTKECEYNEKMSYGRYRENQRLDITRFTVDEKIRELNVSILEIKGKIAKNKIKLNSMFSKITNIYQKMVMKVIK